MAELHLPSPPPESLETKVPTTAPSQLRACENCRRRKIRCPGSADGSKDGPCIKCQKFNRDCVYRSRAPAKRQKRVEVRVRELEQKLLDLAAQLHSPTLPSSSSCEDQSPLQAHVHQPESPVILDGTSASMDETRPLRDDVLLNQSSLAGLRTVSSTALGRTQLWRKPTQRSTAGCSVCKRRKLKCDEKKPFCDRCIKDGRECEYNHTCTLSDRSHQHEDQAFNLRFEHFISALDTLGPMLGIDSSHADRRVFRMLTHWESHTVNSFGPPHLQAAFQRWSFDLASTNPFLLHTICATAALHLQYLQGDQAHELTSLYNYHFELGLELYAKKLSNPVACEDMDAVFAACMLFALMAYQMSEAEPENIHASMLPVLERRADELTWLTVQCGFLTIKRSPTVQPHLSRSIWHELFGESNSQGKELQNSLQMSTIPPEWRELCQIDEDSASDNNPYYDALKLILMTQDIDASKPENFTYFICFPGRMTPEFSMLVHARDPIALLLLAQWLAKMCDMSGWWSAARVMSECYAICAYLEMELSDNLSVQALLGTPMHACGYVSGLSWEESFRRSSLISKIPVPGSTETGMNMLQ